MSASQARLLFISSRIHDIEMKSMNIANTKIRLASEGEQVSNDYVKALNETNFTVTNLSTNQTEQLNYAMIMSYGGALDSYSLQDSKGNVIIDADTLKKYNDAKGDVNKFIDSYGVDRSSNGVMGEYSSKIQDAQSAYDKADKKYITADENYNTVKGKLKDLQNYQAEAQQDLDDFKAKYSDVKFGDTGKDIEFPKSKVPNSETTVGSVTQSGTGNKTKTQGSNFNYQDVSYTEISEVEKVTTDEEVDGYIVTTEITTQYSQDFSYHWFHDSGGWVEDRPTDIGSMQEIYHHEVQYKHDYSVDEEKNIQNEFNRLLSNLSTTTSSVRIYENSDEYKNAKSAEEQARKDRANAFSDLESVKKEYSDAMESCPFNSEEQWYADLFMQIQNGYKSYDDKLLNNNEALENMIKSGEWFLTKKDESNKYIKHSTSSIGLINETTDKTHIARAEAEYNAAMLKINNKEKILDNELKKLDTEHNALNTEMDSVKNLIKENSDKTFNLFS